LAENLHNSEYLGAGEWSEALNRLEQQIDRLDFTAVGKTLAEVAELLGVSVNYVWFAAQGHSCRVHEEDQTQER
jgi:hypothetical protein